QGHRFAAIRKCRSIFAPCVVSVRLHLWLQDQACQMSIAAILIADRIRRPRESVRSRRFIGKPMKVNWPSSRCASWLAPAFDMVMSGSRHAFETSNDEAGFNGYSMACARFSPPIFG
ncbi:MAG: hypothetical protein KGQ48_16610, partial [Bradyrhizobium sp.]|nr:hypothetical protein [Bradyrhizobium sp.]